MIDFDKLPIGAPIKIKHGSTELFGTYFGKERKSPAYKNYPIINMYDPIYHPCVGKDGMCYGLWIEKHWDVIIVQKARKYFRTVLILVANSERALWCNLK